MSEIYPESQQDKMPATPPPPPPPPGPVVPGLNVSDMPLPVGVMVSTPGKRLGQFAIDYLLLILILPWLIWSLFTWSSSQTPGMQILKMKTVKKDTRQRASYGTMALRELVGKYLITMLLIGAVTCGIGTLVLYFMLLWDHDRQQLWDKIAGTIVVDDPQGLIE